jgi:alkylation response protein AidB-like acyl-CoA dehydrogenase
MDHRMIELRELRDAARKAFGEGTLAPDAAKSWAMIAEMGWLMMTVPEEAGGLGLGHDAEGIVHSELGRALVPGPAIAQMMVITALTAAEATAERDALLAQAMGGTVMTTSLGLNNPLSAVLDADRAGHILVVSPDRIALHAAPFAATHRPTWDETRRLFDVTLDESGGDTLAGGTVATALAQRLQSQLLLALAADSLGGAGAILTLTIEYLKTRRQFDRPLAMFQALKHRVADLKILLEGAEALFWSRATGTPTLAELGALKAHATATYVSIAEEAIQLHGGMGLTAEHYCHLFLKRALLNAALGGNNNDWEEMAGRALMETTP